MEKIVKCPKRQDCHYKLTSGTSNETSINISNEVFKVIKPDGVPLGESVDVIFKVFKDDYLKALCYIVGILPLYKTSSGKATKVEYSSSFFETQYKVIEEFFKHQTEADYHVKLFYRNDGRIYLNNLDDRGFNVRRFLIESNSVLTFVNENGNLSLRLTSSKELFGHYSSDSLSNDSLDIAISLLLAQKNLILTGAPGTGKTYLARNIAASVIGDCEWDSLSVEQRKQVGFVQFHPSYDYTDFVEGLRPNEGGEFVRTDGVFKEFCKKAILGDCKRSAQIKYSKSDLNDEAGFQDVIDSLKEDIRIGAVSTYSPTGILRVNSDNRIEYQREKTKKTILESNVELLYEHYVERGKFDISDVGKVEMEALLASLTEACRDKATKTIDFTEYKWTLAELLKRKQEIDNGSYQKAYLSVDENESSTELPYVFIIDEINRGELSKIFGELFYSIEPDYRGPAGRVKTQYNNMVHAGDVFKEGFFIPANVYIIGTMNDIDRGVEAMDFAIRRRFAWKEVTAAESAINMEIPEKVRAVMEALNNALIENGLTEAHCIGGAYFRKLEGSDYKKLWNNHLKGIVTEYFRGEPEADSKVKNIEAAYTKAQEEPAE